MKSSCESSNPENPDSDCFESQSPHQGKNPCNPFHRFNPRFKQQQPTIFTNGLQYRNGCDIISDEKAAWSLNATDTHRSN